MKIKFLTRLTLLLLIGVSLTNCTDPYKMQTDTFEDALVVEATITDVLQKQTVKLSRTYRFEDFGPVTEENADVSIIDSDGNQYDFIEQNNVYTSVNEFKAVPGKQYQLTIITSDGKKYTSTQEILPTASPIQDVVANVETVNNVRGVEIRAKSYDPSGNSQYYRFEYEETYKVIAPKWVSVEAKLSGPNPMQPIITMQPRTTEARVCYSTDKSTEILLVNTNEGPEDRVDFPVRFLSRQNYSISHRYSILVRQYVQNAHAYNYYKALKRMSGSGNILSPNQPGFLNGNIKSVNNPTEKVIGYFDVSTVSTKRIFFNYTDLFPGEPLPAYKVSCNEQVLNYCFSSDPACKGTSILSYLNTNTMAMYLFDEAPIYTMVPEACADCTSFSSNVIPPFWE
ncbi:DUF4249 domain-containing protein [Flavobacterium cerinum]|uniref:DUF4249 domain-containing protein n=1 Tax=Flavobacterium cerinum TaxID=2502784 RepID=A0ABY5ITT1_9FLAO|nr:DUF4249 domain-containing protein [Flavobacterium cerinum]UUC45746.1 DUF4249 domain-containing protein [Flavobacterium cerinum]